jgi:hypothetical protein
MQKMRLRTDRVGSILARATTRAFREVTLTGATTPIWYVTFEVHKRGMLLKQRSPRETKTFATEDEAKIFARSKFEEGLTVYAGTINPHTPKRLVPSLQIDAWLKGERSDDQPPCGENKE